MPSKNKQAFIENSAPSQTMWAAQVESIANHYNEKHQITIYKNGTTPTGKKIIEEKIAKRKKFYAIRTQDYLQENTKYACYALRGFEREMFTLHPDNIGEENYQLIKKLLKDYLLPQVSPDLLEEFREVNEEELPQLNALLAENPAIKKLLDEQIKFYIDEEYETVQEEIKDCCLSNKEAWIEINAIKAQLKDNEKVGYVYTNGSTFNANHFEVLIITNKVVIKPLSWFAVQKTFDPRGKNQFAVLALDNPAILITKASIPSPQADLSSCGSLGFVYLKELLKNNGAQINQYGMILPYYNEQGNVKFFFYPPPQVLRYSQSSKYNEIVKTMLEDSEALQNLALQGNEYCVTTLKRLLQQTITKAQVQKNESVQKYCERILSFLPNFRKAWLEVYETASKERLSMDIALEGGEKTNGYLSYVSNRLQKYANKPNNNCFFASADTNCNLIIPENAEGATASPR